MRCDPETQRGRTSNCQGTKKGFLGEETPELAVDRQWGSRECPWPPYNDRDKEQDIPVQHLRMNPEENGKTRPLSFFQALLSDFH